MDPAPQGIVPLHVWSGYSPLRGPVRLERLVERAVELGHTHLALTDTNNLYAAPRFWRLAEQAGLRPLVGAEVRDARHAAVALVAGLRFKQANETLAGLVQGFEAAGDDVRAAEATFWMGYGYEKRDRPEDAAAFYKRVQSRYPRTPAARHAALRLARLSKPRKP